MQFHLTNAGLAAFPNPANTGTASILIDRIGVSAVALPGAPEDHAGLLALPNELKRLATFAGSNVGDNTIHVTIRDESSDTYTLRTFGLYSDAGVLLAYVTSAEPISEKTPSSMTLIAADLAFVSVLAAEVVFGNTDFLNPPATTVTAGVVRLATAPETAEGVDATKAVTPFGLKSILDGLALVGHKHAAADVTSGVFNVLRIPDLAMAKITGLVAALASKADNGHQHAAGDVTSGVFDVLRIPDLAMAKITGLAAALAAKAAAAHTHVMADITGLAAALASKSDTGHAHAAADVTSGVFNVLRIPDLAMAKIVGLADALATKAAAAHSHVMADVIGLAAALSGKSDTGHEHAAADVTSGVFNVLRIPDLAMAKITGLAAALTAKLDTGDFTWGNLVGRPNVAIRDTDTIFNSVQVKASTNPISGRIYLGDQSAGSRHLLFSGAAYDLPGAPLLVDGSYVWTQATFDPATKAPVSHTHTAAQITDLLDAVWPAGELRMFDQASPPAGVRVLIANGATLSRTTYARLFAAIGTRYGAGDGATTFKLPDWRGVFFRGLDNGRGLDPARALGVFQDSTNKAHTHGYAYPASNDQGGSGMDPNYTFTSEGRTTDSSGGAEARPVNQALLACITY